MLLSFLGTTNAIVKQIGANHGYPVAIDELSLDGGKTFWSDFVYTLADGKGKARCAAGGTKVQQIDKFETVFLTAGEMGMMQKCNQNGGVKARLFEYQVDSWTRSAEEADAIKEFAVKNYGILTPLIAKELLADTTGYWLRRFNCWRKRIKEGIKSDQLILGIGYRIADVMSLYMTACEILAKVAGVEMAVEEVYEFFYFHIILKNAEDANLGVRAYEALVRYFSRYRDRFLDARQYLVPVYTLKEEQEGLLMESSKGHKVGGKLYKTYVVFYPDVAQEILSRQGFVDPVLALKAVQKAGLLKAKDARRIYCEVKVNDVTTQMCGIWIDDID